MPRTLKNNAVGLSSKPNYVTDPDSERELTDLLRRQLIFLRRNYQVGRRVMGAPNDFNRCIQALRLHLSGKRCNTPPARLHPELELLVGHHARLNAVAEGRSGSLLVDDVEAGIRQTVQAVSVKRGRPADPILRVHLAAMMAAVQEATGKPVIAARYKNSIYDPHGSSAGGRFVIEQFRSIDPRLTEATLANAIESIRREYAGQQLRFLDIFPLNESPIPGSAHMAPDAVLQVKDWAPPIYFR